MIKLECPHCGKEISTGDANAGKKGKCPSCKGLLVIPAAPVPARAAVQPARKPGPPPPRSSRGRQEDSDPDPPVAEVVEEEAPLDALPAEEEDRPARRGKSSRVTRDRPPARTARRYEEPDDEDEEEERPRQRRPRKRKGGEWAPCPNCGSTDATRVHYTFWGGLIGPLFINTVRCKECGTSYNGKHGDYNTARIAIFVAICLVIGAVLAVLGATTQH